MRRVSIVSGIAAAVVAGHLGYHLAPRRAPQPVVMGADVASPPLVSATPPPIEAPPPAAVDGTALPTVPCALQPPLARADWKPMLDALRPLVARYELKSPDFARCYRDFVRAPCHPNIL